MNIVESLKGKICGKNLSVVLPEGADIRILKAARALLDQRIAVPTVLGDRAEVGEAAKLAGVDLGGIVVVDPRTSDRHDAYASRYREGRDDLDPAIARRMVRKPLFFGATMVACGDAHAMVAGAAHATATVIQAAALGIRFAPGITTPSSFFLMTVPDFQGQGERSFIFSDCAVNVDPTPEQLADIAIASALSCGRLLGEEPRVAMISFSTCGSASHPRCEKVVRACEIARRRRPDLAIDGEFQADTALIPRVAAKKMKRESPVAGNANVLVFPDLDTGNAAYKLTQYLANASALGPFLQGFAKPVSDLSRGASVDDIVAACAVLLGQG